ncbi:glycosyltransferase family 39 protein [Micromonospora sp. NBC_01699]|uniref:glycosyltransferase family 39 protein n=1 Tax=Micromonospora sp. NBC_01699 TaxID=2975984 RepID=UPI002E330CB0|nr:glycosyltransferase family 39 protein [Micromonospora sp. NBC_01699]
MARTAPLWPALLTLAIALVQIDHAPLWRDELATWSAASRPTGDLFRLAANIDGVAVAYYLLMHGWIELFGDSVTALRLPATLSLAGAAALIAVLGRRLFGGRIGLIAGLLFAVLPSTSRYAQEARPYALATLFAVLATLLLVRALDRPGWWRWTGYAAALVGLGLSHLLATSLVLGHAVAVLLAWRQHHDRRLGRWLLALVPPILVLAPLARLGRDQQARQLGWVRSPTLTDLPDLPGELLQSGTVGGLLVGLAAIGLVSRGRRGVVLGACGLLPVALLYVGGLLTPLWVPRYLLFTVPFACLLAAGPLAPLRLRWALPVVALAGLLGAPAQASLRRTHETPRSAPIDYPAATRIIGAHQQPGDGIVYSPRDMRASLDIAVLYHLREHHPRDVLATEGPVAAATLDTPECPQPATCLTTVTRVWLLTLGNHPADPLSAATPAKETALRHTFQITKTWPLPGLTLTLLTRP